MKRVAIIGGGAAGFFTAANLAPALETTIFEGASKFLSKVAVSGGGRCNVTNNCFDIPSLVASYPRGSNELRGPFARFQPRDTIQWFTERGVALKAESDNRVFPETDSSETIIACLKQAAALNGVKTRLGVKVIKLEKCDDEFELILSDSTTTRVDYVLIATGSGNSGHQFARALGHSITECAPSLFTFKIQDPRIEDLAGVSVPEVLLKLEVATGQSFENRGPLLITHWGLSGPAVLKLSAFAARELAAYKYRATLKVNWMALSQHECRKGLEQIRSSQPRRELGALSLGGISKRLWIRLLNSAEVPEKLRCSEFSNQHVERLSQVLTCSELTISGKGEFKEEFVTCGGVDRKEIDFRNFESKIVPNLFFAGEVIDIDGVTGGFNFQAAWTGGYIVAQAIRARCEL